jgi:alpha-tubulin suppressor-like RCC1 family protein
MDIKTTDKMDNKGVLLLQKHFRGYLFKKKYPKLYQVILKARRNARISYGAVKIQNYFKMYKNRKYYKALSKSLIIIQAFYYRLKSSAFLKKLRKSSKKIQSAFRIYIYRKKILEKYFSSYTAEHEDTQNITIEINLNSLLTLFPNYNFKSINSHRGSTIETKEKALNLQRFFEKKLLTHQPNLLFQASHLKLSPFDEPKLHFFSHILDFDIFINTDDIYLSQWSSTLMEVIKYNINNQTPIQSIELGGMHTALINSSGKNFVWGWNGYGQCGFKTKNDCDFLYTQSDLIQSLKIEEEKSNKANTTIFKKETYPEFYYLAKPTIIENLYCKQISCGDDFTLLLSKEGKIFVCGLNYYNQLGVQGQSCVYKPLQLLDYLHEKLGVIEVDYSKCRIKDARPCGISTVLQTEDGRIIMLSHLTTSGQLISSPKLIHFPNNCRIQSLECGKNFCMFLAQTGAVYAFGENKYGQLGLGDVKPRHYPEPILNLKDLGIKTAQISCGINHVLIRSTAGKVYSWGSNCFGQLGNQNFKNSSIPIAVEITNENSNIKHDIIFISAGLRASAFLLSSRQIFWCGSNGDIHQQHSPVEFHYKNKVNIYYIMFSFLNYLPMRITR